MKRLWAVLAVIACVSAIALVTGSRRDNAGSSVTPAAVPDGNFPSETPLLQCSSPAITPTDVPVTVTPTPQRGAEPTATVIPEATPTPTPTEKPEQYLFISEILPTNSKYNRHNDGYHDMIELCNTSEEPISLAGYYLSDSKKKLTEYPLPETVIPAGGYAVFYCTGKYDAKDESDLKFKLSYFGEKVYLADAEGNIFDTVSYPELPQNVSYGRDGDGFRIYDKPTVGSANEGGYERMSTVPEVDVAPGFYGDTLSVMFTSAGTIRYTLDGSKPTSSSTKWDGKPIVIKKTCTLRAYAVEENCLASFDAAFNYIIDAPDYTLDVAVLSLKKSDFDTMNAHYNSGKKYSANLSLFSGGNLEFSEDCCISVFGATSRAYPKKSYQITFSTAYGPSKLRYPVFKNSDIDEFNSLVLRSGSQDASGAHMRDEYVSSLSVSTGLVDNVLVQGYRPVNLYVNDQYWGIYFIREHIDEDMVASHCGCDPEEVTVVEQMRSVKCGKDGSEWTGFWKYISSNKLKDSEAYEYAGSIVDLQSVADYYIIQLWSGNIDMDNVRVGKAGGKWFFILYDCDLTLVRSVEGTTVNQLGTFNTGYYTFNALINRLLENEEFRELFLQRMATMVSTVFSDEYALAYIDELAERLDHDMVYNCKRWDPVAHSEINYLSYKGWKKAVDSLRRMVKGRGQRIAADFIKAKKIPSELVAKYFPELQ